MPGKEFDALTRDIADLQQRLGLVEERLGGTGDADDTPPTDDEPVAVALALPPAPAGTWWLLEELAARSNAAFDRDGVAGSVVYAGRTTTRGAGNVSWQMERPLADLLEQDWSAAAAVLSALGHPIRLEIIRLLLQGARTLLDLQQIATLGTTGQLQHHLRELRSAGLVEQPRRNDYAIPAARVIPCLVMIAAASGTAPAAVHPS